jgi:hypothetical protein
MFLEGANAMIGPAYWSSGITVAYQPPDRWHASLSFYDDGFATCDADSAQIATAGTLANRYVVPDGTCRSGLDAAIDTLKADAEHLGIGWRDPSLFVAGDGDDPTKPLPADWPDLLAEQAERLGWDCPYR